MTGNAPLSFRRRIDDVPTPSARAAAGTSTQSGASPGVTGTPLPDAGAGARTLKEYVRWQAEQRREVVQLGSRWDQAPVFDQRTVG